MRFEELLDECNSEADRISWLLCLREKLARYLENGRGNNEKEYSVDDMVYSQLIQADHTLRCFGVEPRPINRKKGGVEGEVPDGT